MRSALSSFGAADEARARIKVEACLCGRNPSDMAACEF